MRQAVKKLLFLIGCIQISFVAAQVNISPTIDTFSFSPENLIKYRKLVWDYEKKNSKITYDSTRIEEIVKKLNPKLKIDHDLFTKNERTKFYLISVPKVIAELFKSDSIKSHNYPAVLTDVYVHHKSIKSKESDYTQEMKIEKPFDAYGYGKDIIYVPLLIDERDFVDTEGKIKEKIEEIPYTKALIQTAWDYIKLESCFMNEVFDFVFDNKKNITYWQVLNTLAKEDDSEASLVMYSKKGEVFIRDRYLIKIKDKKTGIETEISSPEELETFRLQKIRQYQEKLVQELNTAYGDIFQRFCQNASSFTRESIDSIEGVKELISSLSQNNYSNALKYFVFEIQMQKIIASESSAFNDDDHEEIEEFEYSFEYTFAPKVIVYIPFINEQGIIGQKWFEFFSCEPKQENLEKLTNEDMAEINNLSNQKKSEFIHLLKYESSGKSRSYTPQ